MFVLNCISLLLLLIPSFLSILSRNVIQVSNQSSSRELSNYTDRPSSGFCSAPYKLLGVTPPVSTDPPKPAEIAATKGLMEELIRQKTFESKDEGRLR